MRLVFVPGELISLASMEFIGEFHVLNFSDVMMRGIIKFNIRCEESSSL
jgi:hypothetical protein